MDLFGDMKEVRDRTLTNIRDFRHEFPASEIEPLPEQRQPNDQEFVAFIEQMVMMSPPQPWVHQKTGQQVFGSAWLLGGVGLPDANGKVRKFIDGRDKDVRRWERLSQPEVSYGAQ